MSSYALITGASKGIGRSLAISLARRKYDLLLAARSSDDLAALCTQLTAGYGVQAHYLALDLTQPDAALQVRNWCAERQFKVSLLVNNAGYGVWGYFDEMPLADQCNMLQLNMQLPVELTYYMIPFLREHSKAYILNVSSTAAYQALPTMTLYAASKSFMLTFSRGLRHELKRTQIAVSCLCPGPVNTNFIERAKMQAVQATAEKFGMTPERVAEKALKGLFAGKAEIIPGALNVISATAARLLPKSLIENIAAGLYKKK
jgi:short-subunit dehydrogenase